MEIVQLEFYLDKFIGVIQGTTTEQRQMTHYLFHSINELF